MPHPGEDQCLWGEKQACGGPTSVLDDQDFLGAQQLLGDDDAAQSILGDAAGVADDVRVAEMDAKGGGRIDARVHAGHDDVALGWRQRQRPLREAGRVRLVGADQILLHCCCHGGGRGGAGGRGTADWPP